jgi:hypothetical protein
MFPRGASWKSLTVIVCNASMVADGGVFSPRMGLGVERLILADSFIESRGVGVDDRLLDGVFSGELLYIESFSFLQTGVADLEGRSGERSGVRFASRKLRISRTLPV